MLRLIHKLFFLLTVLPFPVKAQFGLQIPDSLRDVYDEVTLSDPNAVFCGGSQKDDTVYKAVRSGKMGMLDSRFREIVPPVYDEAVPLAACQLSFRLFLTANGEPVYGERSFGLTLANGRQLFEPAFSYIGLPEYPLKAPDELHLVVAEPEKPGLFGVVDASGVPIVPIAFDFISLYSIQGDSSRHDRYYAFVQQYANRETRSKPKSGLYNLVTGKSSGMYDQLKTIDSLTIFRSGNIWGVLDANYDVLLSGMKDELLRMPGANPSPFDDWRGYEYDDFRHYDDSILLVEHTDELIDGYGELLFGCVNIYTGKRIPTVHTGIQRFGSGFLCEKDFFPKDKKGVVVLYDRSFRKRKRFRVGQWHEVGTEGLYFIDRFGRCRLLTWDGNVFPADGGCAMRSDIRLR